MYVWLKTSTIGTISLFFINVGFGSRSRVLIIINCESKTKGDFVLAVNFSCDSTEKKSFPGLASSSAIHNIRVSVAVASSSLSCHGAEGSKKGNGVSLWFWSAVRRLFVFFFISQAIPCWGGSSGVKVGGKSLTQVSELRRKEKKKV